MITLTKVLINNVPMQSRHLNNHDNAHKGISPKHILLMMSPSYICQGQGTPSLSMRGLLYTGRQLKLALVDTGFLHALENVEFDKNLESNGRVKDVYDSLNNHGKFWEF